MDFHTGVFAKINERFGTSYDISQAVTWDFSEMMPQDHCEFLWGSECFHCPELQAGLEPVPGALKAIHTMLGVGEELVIVSDRPETLFEPTCLWLSEHGLGQLPVVFTNRSSYPKVKAAQELELQFVVEDSPHNATDLCRAYFIEHTYLLNMPYNQAVDDKDNLTRVRGWTDVSLLHAWNYGWSRGLDPSRGRRRREKVAV